MYNRVCVHWDKQPIDLTQEWSLSIDYEWLDAMVRVDSAMIGK